MVERRLKADHVSEWVSWRGAIFGALVFFGFVTLISKVLHAEDAHTQQEADLHQHFPHYKSGRLKVRHQEELRAHKEVILQSREGPQGGSPSERADLYIGKDAPLTGSFSQNLSVPIAPSSSIPDASYHRVHNDAKETLEGDNHQSSDTEESVTLHSPPLPYALDQTTAIDPSKPEPSGQDGDPMGVATKSAHDIYPESVSIEIRNQLKRAKEESLPPVSQPSTQTGSKTLGRDTSPIAHLDADSAASRTAGRTDSREGVDDASHPDQWGKDHDPTDLPPRPDSWRASAGDNLTRAVIRANRQLSGSAPVDRPQCYGAPEPWQSWGAKLSGLKPFVSKKDAEKNGQIVDAVRSIHLESKSSEGPGRRLNGFQQAGKGGKTGISCHKNAPMKAKQACAESRALKRCALEEKGGEGGRLSGGEKMLAVCLRDGEGAPGCTAGREVLRGHASQLKGIKMLASARPRCIFQNHAGNCSSFERSAETGLYMGGCGQRGGGPATGCNMDLNPALPKEDLQRRYHTCAVVGNSMNLFRTASGASIDRHDAVFRFNNEADRMLYVLRDWMTPAKLGDFLGRKSTVRLLNRKYTYQMLNHEVGASDLRDDDFVVFWNYFTVPYMKYLQAQYPSSRLYVLSPELLNWELAVFSQLRSDLLRLGLGPFECYRFMSSGVHGLLLSLLLCGEVDVYGFSITMDNFKEGFNHGRPSESHSWQFETMLMRLMYYVGAIDVCNT